ncbi:MAG: hypothetical protein QS98_C0006G0004 [archaeon GW2011_AR3]|nr:MAG: hypothetical protein QS98_C0006G0004 [archaeon GW2011_AR3]MBS3109234.1 hypothetical protein [Candidatus Woesearchaeota archaeon]
MGEIYCHGGYCNKCRGMMWIVGGILILANVYWLKWDWWVFIAALIILKGLSKTVMPMCSCCRDQMKKAGRKK